jgi:hypothetical protein
MNGDVEKIWKEAVVADIILAFSGWTEENHETFSRTADVPAEIRTENLGE